MTRQQAVTIIRCEVAEHGRTTQTALRAYVENRVAFKAFQTACAEGMQIFNKRRIAGGLQANVPAEESDEEFARQIEEMS